MRATCWFRDGVWMTSLPWGGSRREERQPWRMGTYGTGCSPAAGVEMVSREGGVVRSTPSSWCFCGDVS